MWKCHLCKVVWLKATHPACLTASCKGHTPCHLCTDVTRSDIPEDRAIDSISKPAQHGILPSSDEGSLPIENRDIKEEDSFHISIVIDDDTLEAPRHYDETVPMHDLPRPSMAGWWRCCKCTNDNNPALVEGVCGVCGHARDYYCTSLG